MALAVFTHFLLSQIGKVEKNHKTSGIGLRMLLAAIVRGNRDVARASTEHPSFVEKYLTDVTPQSVAAMPGGTPVLSAKHLPLLVWYFGQTIEDHPTLAFSRTSIFCSLPLFHRSHEYLSSVG